MSAQEIVVVCLGGLFVAVGLVGALFLRRSENHKIKIGAVELETSNASLVVLALGAIILTVGWKAMPSGTDPGIVPPPSPHSGRPRTGLSGQEACGQTIE